MQSLLQDLRYSLRQLINSPGFSLTAVISLALGIGATTAVFSVIYGLLVNPYPYLGANQMIEVTVLNENGNVRGVGFILSATPCPLSSPSKAAQRSGSPSAKDQSPERAVP